MNFFYKMERNAQLAYYDIPLILPDTEKKFQLLSDDIPFNYENSQSNKAILFEKKNNSQNLC